MAGRGKVTILVSPIIKYRYWMRKPSQKFLDVITSLAFGSNMSCLIVNVFMIFYDWNKIQLWFAVGKEKHCCICYSRLVGLVDVYIIVQGLGKISLWFNLHNLLPTVIGYINITNNTTNGTWFKFHQKKFTKMIKNLVFKKIIV